MKKNILIIGGDSLIGSQLKHYLGTRKYVVYSTTRRQAENTNNSFFLDLSKPDSFDFPSSIKIDVVIICAAMTSVDLCEKNPALCKSINVESLRHISERLKSTHNPFFVFLSTNAVFDDNNPWPVESDTPHPFNQYGESKWMAELTLRSITEKLAILRITKVLHEDNTLLKKWAHDLKNQEIIHPSNELTLAPVLLDHVLLTINKIILRGLAGIFHLSSDQDLSYYELALLLAKKLNVKKDMVQIQHFEKMKVSPKHHSRLNATLTQQILNTKKINHHTVIQKILSKITT